MALKPIIPFTDFGGKGAVVHFAHANGYLPGCYGQVVGPLLANYRVLGMHARPVWPGREPSSLTNWSDMADDLIDFLDEQQLQDIVGIGHSMGGIATLYAAQARPELFRALVLIEPVFLPESLLQHIEANPALAEHNPLYKIALKRRFQWPSRAEAFQHFRSKRVFGRFSDAALHDYVNTLLEPAGDGHYTLRFPREWEARIYRTPPTDVWRRIPLTIHPTLAIRGAETDTIREDDWQQWQTLQPQATFVEIPDTTHLLTMEQPNQVAQTITAFLNKIGYA